MRADRGARFDLRSKLASHRSRIVYRVVVDPRYALRYETEGNVNLAGQRQHLRETLIVVQTKRGTVSDPSERRVIHRRADGESVGLRAVVVAVLLRWIRRAPAVLCGDEVAVHITWYGPAGLGARGAQQEAVGCFVSERQAQVVVEIAKVDGEIGLLARSEAEVRSNTAVVLLTVKENALILSRIAGEIVGVPIATAAQ